MNYIKEAENVLWYYNNIYNSLRNLDRQIERLVKSQGPSELSAGSIDMSGVRGSRVDNTENMLHTLQILTDCKHESLLALDEADRVMQEISAERGCEQYGKVLRLWYIEKWPKEDIAAAIGYQNRRDIYRIRDRAIQKFAVNMFGIRAAKAI